MAAGSGAHLASAVIGGLSKEVTFKKIIGKFAKISIVQTNHNKILALDPVLPLLETDLFLQLLPGRSNQIIVVHSSAGSYVSSIKFPPLVLSGASILYVAPGDLTPFCGVGPSQCKIFIYQN